MMKKTYLSIIVILTIMLSSCSNIKNISVLDDNIYQYHRADFEINLVGQWNNPYLQEEVTLDMIITTPSGKSLMLPCFYEKGESDKVSTWAARFTPQEVGEYGYKLKYQQEGKEVSISKRKTFEALASADKKGFLHVNNNWTLKFDNGELFRGIGENICWESRKSDDSKFFKDLHQNHDKYSYGKMLPLFAKNGGNFFRVWMCPFNFPIDRQDNFNNTRYTASDKYFNPSATSKLDSLVELSDSLGLYIMLCMNSGDVRPNHDFFITEAPQMRYKNYLRYIVARWGYSTSIGMWEFFNEIDNIQFRNPDKPIPAEDIVAWHAEMSKYLKSIDPYKHITTTSISHRDLKGLNSVKDLDINQKHIYKHTDWIPSTIVKYEKEFGKPYIIGEFGYEWDWNKNFDDFADEMDVDFKRGLWYGIFSPTPVTPMSWWWEYFDSHNLVPYFRGVREISDQMLIDGNGAFKQISASAGNCVAYGLLCGKTIYVYLFNPTSKLQKTHLLVDCNIKGDYEIVEFNPTKRSYTKKGNVKVLKGLSFNDIKLAPHDEILYIFSKEQ